MQSISIARYFLIASAFVLGGLLFTAVFHRGGLDQAARGDLLVAKDGLTLMTAKTRSDEEAVFVLDSVNEQLLIYTLDLRGTGGRLELRSQTDLRVLFAQ